MIYDTACEQVGKPWGAYQDVGLPGDTVHAKLIRVAEGQRTSLQYRRGRVEHWYVLEGGTEARVGGSFLRFEPGGGAEVLAGQAHRLGPVSKGGCVVLEVSVGRFDEGDVVRLEDDYGRVKVSSAGGGD